MDLIVGENTYISLEDFEEITNKYVFSDDPIAQILKKMSNEDKVKMILRGCMDMEKLRYRGVKKTSLQKLAFPRVNRSGFESDSEKVKLAQVLNSLSFLSSEDSSLNSRIKQLSTNGVTSFHLGSFSISLKASGNSMSYKSNSGNVEEVLSIWLTGGVNIRWLILHLTQS